MDHPSEGGQDFAIALFCNLQARATTLLGEFREYQAHLKLHKTQQDVEVRAFKRGIESEVKMLQKLSHVFAALEPSGTISTDTQGEPSQEPPQVHALRSSNLPFYEAVWTVAKSSRSVSALCKKMYFGGNRSSSRPWAPGEDAAHRSFDLNDVPKRAVTTDVVAENGLRWTKVSTLTEKRLLFEMAKEGWERYGDWSDEDAESGGDEGASHGSQNGHKAGKLELVQLAEDLHTAARSVRMRFRHPQIQIVLPNIREGVLDDVDAFLADLRLTGATVQCGGLTNAEQLDLDRMMPTPVTSPLTKTINMDCTLLLALISDISHFSREQLAALPFSISEGGYHKAIRTQIEAEETSPMLPVEVYPLLAGRDLLCTSHAAQRMREIVQTMATPSEATRADIFLGEGVYEGQPVEDLQRALASCSRHCVPIRLRLPVAVIEVDLQGFCCSPPPGPEDATVAPNFPAAVALRAKDAAHLTPINTSVFLYGWMCRLTTFTSNRAVASAFLRAINEILDSDEGGGAGHDGAEFLGPLIHVCETARSLVGKTKAR
jgi:hypothetical protein